MKTEIEPDTKKHILEIAEKEFFSKSYGSASINAISDAARITKPTIYYHFGSKEGLFNALVEEAYNRCDANRRTAVDVEASIKDQIFQAIMADFNFCLEQPELLRFVLAVTFALPEETKCDLRPAHLRDFEFFQDIIRRGNESDEINCADTGSAALALQGTIAINIVSYLKMENDKDFLSEERARRMTTMFFAGINQN